MDIIEKIAEIIFYEDFEDWKIIVIKVEWEDNEDYNLEGGWINMYRLKKSEVYPLPYEMSDLTYEPLYELIEQKRNTLKKYKKEVWTEATFIFLRNGEAELEYKYLDFQDISDKKRNQKWMKEVNEICRKNI